jgi:UDP-GlcNAc:undecaprenyl-phosphate GlcNAc-1-phosphate transferase
MADMNQFLSQALNLFFASTVIAYIATPLVRKLAIKANIYDTPGLHKRHKTPTPQLGGIAIYLAFLIPISLYLPLSPQLLAVLLGATLMVFLGVIDDTLGTNAWIKFFGQIVIAFITYQAGLRINWVTNPMGGLVVLDWLSLPLTILWIVGITNAINLMDGVDGLASGMSGISAGILAFVAYQTNQPVAALLLIAILGANLGFLRYNFAPAKIFMGDSGSMMLGYLLSTVSILGVLKSTVTLSLIIPILALGIPISDTLYSIFRRLKNKQPIFKADNGHFHHKLLDRGLSPKQVVLGSYAVTSLLGILAIVISTFAG